MKRLVICFFLLCSFAFVAKAQNQCGIMANGNVGPGDSYHLAVIVVDNVTHEQHLRTSFKPYTGATPVPCQWSVDLPLPQVGKVIGVAPSNLPTTWNIGQNVLTVTVFFEDGKAYVTQGVFEYHGPNDAQCYPPGGWSSPIYDFSLNCPGPVSTDKSTWGGVKQDFKK